MDSTGLMNDITFNLDCLALTEQRQSYRPPTPENEPTPKQLQQSNRVQEIFDAILPGSYSAPWGTYTKDDNPLPFDAKELREAIEQVLKTEVPAQGLVVRTQSSKRLFVFNTAPKAYEVSFCNQEDILGVGGYGVVYSGYRIGFGPSAFKMALPSQRSINPHEALREEVEVRRLLANHEKAPGLPPRFYAFHQAKDFEALEMPRFLHTLAHELQASDEGTPLERGLLKDFKARIGVGTEMARGLSLALQILHRYTFHHDLTPCNVATDGKRFYLIDFKKQPKTIPPANTPIGPFDPPYSPRKELDTLLTLIRHQGAKGVPEGRDPNEYFRDRSEKLDVFQLAATVYCAVFFELPYQCDVNEYPVPNHHLNPTGIPASLSAFFTHGLDFDPDKRHTVAKQVAIMELK